MGVSKKDIFAYLAIIFSAAIAILLINFTENIWLHVACIWLVAFIAADISGIFCAKEVEKRKNPLLHRVGVPRNMRKHPKVFTLNYLDSA